MESKNEPKMINWYSTIQMPKKENPHYDLHKLDVIFRAIICTASGGGKTNLLMNLLYLMNNTFYEIIIITKEEEPLYTMLKERLGDRVKIFYNGEIPDLPALNDKEAGIVIFDDMGLTQSKKIGEVFIRCRKQHYSAIFISQSYFGINKLIRQNCNYIWLGRGILERDLKLILSEYSIRIPKAKMLYLYDKITTEHMHFMMVDLKDRTIRRDISEVILEF